VLCADECVRRRRAPELHDAHAARRLDLDEIGGIVLDVLKDVALKRRVLLVEHLVGDLVEDLKAGGVRALEAATRGADKLPRASHGQRLVISPEDVDLVDLQQVARVRRTASREMVDVLANSRTLRARTQAWLAATQPVGAWLARAWLARAWLAEARLAEAGRGGWRRGGERRRHDAAWARGVRTMRSAPRSTVTVTTASLGTGPEHQHEEMSPSSALRTELPRFCWR
jgi:hypothetical protein